MDFFSLFLFSCDSKQEVISLDFDDQSLESRMFECGPQGDCGPTRETTFSFGDNKCTFYLTLRITICDQGGTKVVYFEDDDVLVRAVGDCNVTPQTVDNLYAQAIENYMDVNLGILGYPLPGCGTGTAISSKQIKVNCSQLCPQPNFEGEGTIYSYKLCQGEVTSFCIETIDWCRDTNGDPNPTPPSSTTYGACSGTPTNACNNPFNLPGATTCIADRCN